MQIALVIRLLQFRELQAVGRGDHDHALIPADVAARHQFLERGEGDAGMRTIEHPRAIRARGGVAQLGFARLFHEAVESRSVLIALPTETGLPI